MLPSRVFLDYLRINLIRHQHSRRSSLTPSHNPILFLPNQEYPWLRPIKEYSLDAPRQGLPQEHSRFSPAKSSPKNIQDTCIFRIFPTTTSTAQMQHKHSSGYARRRSTFPIPPHHGRPHPANTIPPNIHGLDPSIHSHKSHIILSLSAGTGGGFSGVSN